MELSNEIMYKAIVERDASFEGVFFTAVRTTGIFCRPSCTARKPKEENVEFFSTIKEAINSGYRPCKVCNPLEMPGETPDYIKNILKELNNDPLLKLKDGDLIDRGIEPSRVRRWFLKNHGMTFQSFQRLHRINSAFKKIKNGESVTGAAFDSGYESLSGFNESFKSVFGASPVNSKQKNLVNITRIETPLGTMLAGADENGICLLEFTDRKMLAEGLKTLSKHLNANLLPGENKWFPILKEQLDEYFKGIRRTFSIPISLHGTEFQQSSWQILQTIPYGSTFSYKHQAASLMKPNAVRAVANANGLNRIAIIIPCHRVIGEDGNLAGYGGGVWRKKWLLDFERLNLGKEKLRT
jgi:AraC family transcriptional regulator of adaptative response/methylated-DNA-[protein]-cysteine methyltransferase